MAKHQQRQPAHLTERHGSLDVPISVWRADTAEQLTAHLFAEFRPARGPVAVIDLPGWESIARLGRRTAVYCRDARDAEDRLARLPEAKQAMVDLRQCRARDLADRLKHDATEPCGLALASTWLLACTGALAAAADRLRTGGFLAVVGRTDRDAAALARMSQPQATGHGAEPAGLAFLGHIATAPATVYDAAVARAQDDHASAGSRLRRHFDIAVWSKQRPAMLGGGARG